MLYLKDTYIDYVQKNISSYIYLKTLTLTGELKIYVKIILKQQNISLNSRLVFAFDNWLREENINSDISCSITFSNKWNYISEVSSRISQSYIFKIKYFKCWYVVNFVLIFMSKQTSYFLHQNGSQSLFQKLYSFFKNTHFFISYCCYLDSNQFHKISDGDLDSIFYIYYWAKLPGDKK